jgi:glycosyltransferase involved in cell wall biosynthesis
MKKIAVICNYELLPERVGGMDYFYWLFNSECKNNNIEVTWFFPNKSNHGKYDELEIEIPKNNESLETCFLKYCEDVNVNFDVVYVHFLELCTVFYKQLKAKNSSTNLIVVDHNPRPINGYSFKRRLEKLIKGFLYAKYINCFVSVSNESAKELKRDFVFIKDKACKVIFNGLIMDKYIKKTDLISNKKFLVTSHLRKEKGIQDLVEVVNEIHKNNSFDYKIDVYGNGNYESEIKKRIANYNIESYFNFKGSVNNLNELYKKYDYLIHPSYAETFCYSVIESLICNVPVITTNRAGNILKQVEENKTGHLFNPKDTKQLCTIMTTILNTKKNYDFSDFNANASTFDIQNMVNQYLKLLNS